MISSRHYHDAKEYDIIELDDQMLHLAVGTCPLTPPELLRFFLRHGNTIIWVQRSELRAGEQVAYEFKLDNLDSLFYLLGLKPKCRLSSDTSCLSLNDFNKMFKALGMGFSYDSVADRVVLEDVELSAHEYEHLTKLLGEFFPLIKETRSVGK